MKEICHQTIIYFYLILLFTGLLFSLGAGIKKGILAYVEFILKFII